MQVGNIWLKIDATGSNIQLAEVTPAEVAILNADHEGNAKGVAVFDVTVVGNIERSGEVEIERLRAKYANAKDKKGELWAEKLYPGKNPVLPQTFAEVGVTPISDATKAAPTKPATPATPATVPPAK